MSERISRGKTRLVTHESIVTTMRKKARLLGKVLPEDTIKIPKIGEWSLSRTNESQVDPTPPPNDKRGNKSPRNFRGDSRKEISIEAPFKIRAPRAILDSHIHGDIQKVSFPAGTTSTDIDTITKSKVKQPNRPLPPLRSKIETNEKDSFLPLEIFDDSTYAEYTISELLSNPDAFTKYQELSGEIYWVNCRCIGYDKDDGLFIIEWDKTKRPKKVARFNIRFAIESEEKFQMRLEAARRACRSYEMQYRFDSRVLQMPTDCLPELSLDDIENMWADTDIEKEPKYAEIAKQLCDETKSNFKTINNQLDFIYELEHNPLIPDRDEFLNLFDRKSPRTDYGLVAENAIDFTSLRDMIESNLLLANPHVLQGLLTISATFQNSSTLAFLAGGYDELIKLEEFMGRQTTGLEQTCKLFKSSVKETLEAVISSIMNEEFSLSRSRVKISYQKMITFIQRMLHTVLLDMIESTLRSYSYLFTRYIDSESAHLLPAQFDVSLVINGDNKLDTSPSLSVFRSSILGLLSRLEDSVTVLPEIKLPVLEVDMSTVSFADCVARVVESRDALGQFLLKLFEEPQKFLDSYRTVEPVLSLDPGVFASDFDPDGKRTLDDYRNQLSEFNKVLETCTGSMSFKYKIGIFEVTCERFKEDSTSKVRSLIEALLVHMKTYAIKEITGIQDEFNNIIKRVREAPQTPEELASLKVYMEDVNKTKKDRQKKMEIAMQRFAFLEEFKHEISDEECQSKYSTLQMPQKLHMAMEETERTTQAERVKMVRELRNNQHALETSTLEITEQLPTFISKYQDLEMTLEAVDKVNEIQTKLMGLRAQQDLYSKHEELFGFDPTPCRALNKLIEEFMPLYVLWNLAGDWFSMSTKWLDDPFPQVKSDTMNAFIVQSTKKAQKLKKDLNNHKQLIDKVLTPLSSQLDGFKKHIPLIARLRHPGIKTKHWEKISEIVGFQVMPSMELSLQGFLDLDLGRWNQQITEIAQVASQEYNIESTLDQMDAELQTKQFVTNLFRDTGSYILADIDDMISVIDDQLVTTQTLLTSPFVAPVKKRALEKLAFLRHSHETLDAWVECQRGWLYLQPIFTGTSIQQKLQREARDWQSVEQIWTSTMTMTHTHPEFMTVMHRDRLLEDLVDANKLLDGITRGLNAYLEAKRLGFPRFFFLSNDELITILSHTKDFDVIQKSMNKLFEYVQTITVNEAMQISHMNDDGLETVKFLNTINGNTNEIEDWLNAFEQEMQNTLKESIKESIPAASKKKREQWLSDFPAQVVLTANQILWTSQVTAALKAKKPAALQTLLTRFLEQLDGLTSMIRQPLTPATRQCISCMLIFEVHNRDIINSLIKDEICDTEDFKWLQQLRYYWEEDTVMVRSINNTYEYAYEYAGNSARLVITPLTDRCYQTLLAAFKQNIYGAPSGPAGTGKTETVRDCAKALGRPCVVYNCSEEVTPEQMAQFFAGLSSSGAWACFDEFNRINIEVLSVIAQQVRTIQEAITANVESFVLDGRQLKLNTNAAICITMNPGYAGRTELPDNLKALFRPCAMMVPDFVFISEIMLFSGGYTTASILSVKLVAVFELCKKQLSNANHYDWGLRAMKAILTTAGKSKRNNLDADEAFLLVQVIKDCTRPRLINTDIPLFEGIVRDVFPEVDVSKVLDEALERHIRAAYIKLNANPMDIYITKCNEIYETTLVRHGLMFVGGAMGGKSVAWKALQIALGTLAEEGTGKPVETFTLNPKAISIPELYGLFDPVTSGWSDGVLSSFIRDCSLSEPTALKWIIVDGPVDAMWIETMNSLLDDNKVLCLSNNERISLGAHVKMMFEVDDLSQASPATVSRCGMVFFDPSSLPWQAICDSWTSEMKEKHGEVVQVVRDEMEKYVPKMLAFIQTDGKIAMDINPMFLVKNMTKIIESFFDILRKPMQIPAMDGEDPREVDPLDHSLYYSRYSKNRENTFGYFDEENRIEPFKRIFIFSLVWSFGTFLVEDSRPIFDSFLKELMEKDESTCPFPQDDTVFDYFIDFDRNEWSYWVDGELGIENMPREEMDQMRTRAIESSFIPTNESAAILFISRLLIEHQQNVLYHGPESSKSLIVKTLFDDVLNRRKFDCRDLPVANCSTASNILKVFRSFMHKRQGVFGPLNDMQLVIFLDNIGSVKPECYGAQPPLELIRQLNDYGGWYNTSNIEFQRVVDTTLVAAMGPPGGGLFSISERLMRHFNLIHNPRMRESSMNKVLKALLRTKFNSYEEDVKQCIDNTVQACINLHKLCCENLLPIPSKLHYIFSLRNIIRVIKGILMVNEKDLTNKESYIRLWYHEMMREYYDRFNSDEDRTWYKETITKEISETFKVNLSKISNDREVMFNEFADRAQRYKETEAKPEDVLRVCRDMLENHNRDAAKTLDIVIFDEAVAHISSLNRILTMPRGHAMLVGVKSSGRRSLARLGLHMSSMESFEVTITRTYSFTEWREDMKNLMKNMGLNDLPTGFIISDAQIIGNFQLEDISNLLIRGEIPNLFERDEMEQIKGDIMNNEMMTEGDPWQLFMQRVRSHLHIILVFSPYGNTFKESMLAFPALRTETTIDWYMPWSVNALESVAFSAFSHASIGDKSLIKSVVNVCVKMHKSVEEAAVMFLHEAKRFTACTPSRYFELLNTFVQRLSEEQARTSTDVKKYVGGVEKITTTRGQIEDLSQKLDRDIPVLENKKKDVELMLKDLKVKQAEVEGTKIEVQKQSDVAEEEEKIASEKNAIAQQQLAEAQPILQGAQDAVDSMDKDSLVNIKTLKKISAPLRETFEAICIIFERQPRKVDGDVPGKKIDDYWPETLTLLNDVQFIRKIKNLEVDKLPKTIIDKLKKYVGSDKKDRERKLNEVKAGYKAVSNLYLWVCASYDYWHVYQKILPVKLEADAAAAKLEESRRILAEARAQLQAVEDQLKALQQKFEEEKAREKELSDNVATTQVRLDRAQKIMSGLSGETQRWAESADKLKDNSQYLMGDALLVAGAMTNLAAFSPSFRTRLIDQWKEFLTSENIKFTQTFSISTSLGNDTTIREWIVKGLPNDTHSVENALIIDNSKSSFPLLIDPQLSGTKWLRAVIGETLVVLRFDQSDFLQRLKGCVSFGIPVLIDNVGLKLDPLIEPILSREFVNVDGQKKVGLGGEFVQYSDSFRLYLSTKYPNPHYSPEICSQVTLVNFTTTQDGLTDLLMNNLIEVERKDLDTKRIEIMEANATNMKKLKEVEAEILQIVSNAGSDILEDNKAIETLQRAQKTSAMIEQQMAASKKTEELIAQFREKFLPIAQRAALLYFCASDFSVVDPMYQFSLKWFVSLFKTAVTNSEHPTDQTALISALHIAIARAFYQAVSFSLFSRHKLLFSTLMAIRIQLSEGKINGSELAFILQPSVTKEPNQSTDNWMPDEIWHMFSYLPHLGGELQCVFESLKTNEEEWKAFYRSTTPENEDFPLKDKCSLFQRLVVLRIFHLHRVREGIRIYVSESLGKEFMSPPPLNLAKVFQESSPLAPLIFIITPGIDPQDEIIQVATSMDLDKYLKSYSLGRGRGAGAEELIDEGAAKGFWILLQNCHLSLSWMPRVEQIIDSLDPKKVNPRFRLCLVTMSSPDFPIGILYQGSKLIYEIPKGIRENMLRVYQGITQEEYENDYSLTEKQLTFHLSFFHAVVLERIQFGSIGWNIPYEFNPSDLAISRKHLRTFLSESTDGHIPFESLSYVIGELNYGGRVTDKWDRRLLLSLLSRYFSPEIEKPSFTFGKNYPAPSWESTVQEVNDKLSTWPIVTEGVDVGLSENASTITARNDALGIFNSLIEIQPTLVAASGSVSEEEFALNLVDGLIKEIPQPFNVYNFTKKFDLTDTINTVLHHEILLYNKLLEYIKSSLITLQKGLKGLIVIDEELELLSRRVLSNKVPEAWLNHSFPSILTLRAYIDDLKYRVEFLDKWVRGDRPVVFKLGAFYHPEEFLTAVLQVYARKHVVSFDSLSWATTVLPTTDPESFKEPPEEGIYIEGLYLEGAKWDLGLGTLVECEQKELISNLPVMHLMPTRDKDLYDMSKTFELTMYRMQNRGSGAMGLPNYIMSLFVPTPEIPPDHWIQRSVAAFITVQT